MKTKQIATGATTEQTVRAVEDFIDGFFAGESTNDDNPRMARLAHGLTRVVEQYRESGLSSELLN